ncbi:MAG: PAS domain S-box protein [Elusimicrobiota bacterium]|nr:MAG: PAS domain S-box protein [Elusimicrobiota bacterium]
MTAQNKESRDLLAAEARLRLLVDAAKDYSFLMLDPGGRIWSWHEGARRLKGYEEGEVFGRHCSLFHTPADVRRGLPARLLRRALRFGRAEERCQIVRKDGSRFPAEVVVTPARDAAGVLRGFARVTRDTTAGDRAAEAVGLSRSIVRAEEAERRRIARELHDGVNQLLAAAKHRVQDAEERLAAGGSPRPVLAEARAVLDSTIQEVRRISQNLRPAALDEFGLKAALAGACADFRRATGARISLDAARLPAALDEETELMLYRITQEALTNAARHAGARRVEVQALRRGPNILLSVRDDGKGFTVAMSGSGLKNIQERAQFLGGRCEIHSRPGAGTRVLVIMPTP